MQNVKSAQPGMAALEDLLACQRDRVIVSIVTIMTVCSYVVFWGWWISIHQTGLPLLDACLTLLALNKTINDIFRQAMLLRAKRIRRDLPIPSNLRVGMVVTKAPSEPWSVLEKTLTGALNQSYPHPYEVWLADEAPTDEARAWCSKHGVHISTRQGIVEYHQPCWPRRTRCKEGNLAYFYDHYGYARFDVVCQFDADHVPEPSYLATLLPAFTDPEVGYVALPSICGANRKVSWAVRGRLYEEDYMHGPLGASMSKIALPACIGSHYAVRTAALKKAGGIGPELNEDFSTSYIMTAQGFRGVFSMDTIANGDGPTNFEDCMRQEYQWARSAMVLVTAYLGRYTPGELTVLERFRATMVNTFWVAQGFAALNSLAIAVGPSLFGLQLMPGLLSSGHSALSASIYFLFPAVVGWCNWLLCYQHGWLRPVDTCFWSYEKMLHTFCKPWWILLGTVHGLLGGLLGINYAIKVTPKGDSGEALMGPKNVLPFLCYATACIAALAWGSCCFKLPLLLCCAHLLAAASVVGLHYKENHLNKNRNSPFPWRNLQALALPIAVLSMALCVVLVRRHELIFAGVGGQFVTHIGAVEAGEVLPQCAAVHGAFCDAATFGVANSSAD